MAVYSASSIMAEKRFADGFFFLKRQGLFAILGFLVMMVAMQVDYRHLQKLAVAIFFLAVINLVPLLGSLANWSVLLAGMGALSRQLYQVYRI